MVLQCVLFLASLFFFQAEDGIRDLYVTGVQTCALPILSAKFDLSLSLAERRGGAGEPAGLVGSIEYASDLFEEATVGALAERLVRLLAGAVGDPQRAIGSLEILSSAERRRIVEEWNATE